MKKSSRCLILFLLLAKVNLYSQKAADKDHYSLQVRNEVGDLNNDQHDDKVIVEMDVKDDTRPLRLQIFLSQPNSKKLQLVVSTTKLIESQYPADKKGEYNGNTIPDFIIEDGHLKMLTDINDRKSSYEFRYKQNNFELIKISRVSWDGKNTTAEAEIDLLAKTKIEFEQELGSDKILNKRKKGIKIEALPKIQDLSFSDLEQY
ncbi:hypothetical protein C1637_05910 [Chryseobacterium lactis]|uniref:Uncharacterized protein n=1 Tax=Chryseobacterium lactis TaxID=1241981 RepID=A0A3G6RRV1_CHRLC|nr:hypothetical protein [Chryseobacterium lactis]AZA84376.1 hypothetical protein EG342_21880 [Chryseobacterium lactis]AZB04764.1 hypothetical protein EG341_12760 [Chryseobacterium lactis]PNW14494.1 hypothetical protein C1637_05910 [Chryseobacterium lactis]